MGIRLRPRDPATCQVGNAIIYGGESKFYKLPDPAVISREVEVFYVETDFGNHMTLTWPEIERMFIVVGWQDYRGWKAARAELQNQPNLIERQRDEP